MTIKHPVKKFLILLILIFILNMPCVQAINTDLISFKDFKGNFIVSTNKISFERKTLSEFLSGSEDTLDNGNKIRVVMKVDNSSIMDGIDVEAKSGNLVQALIPPEKLREFGKTVYVREPLNVIPQTISQGVGVINASELHSLNITGEGVKVAVIDIGFYNWDSNPEIWNVEEIKSFRSDNSTTADEHGTGCAEIILDVAPNASLYLYTVSTDVELLQAIDYAISKDVDVISMSLGLLNAGGYDGTGAICEKVNEAHDSGIFFVVAAGNFAPYHYEGNFTDNDSNDFHEFSGSDEVLNLGIIGFNEYIEVFLSWYDWPTSNQDYDMCLVKWNDSISDWELVECSENPQTGTQEPVEYIDYTAQSTGEYGVVIYNYSANKSVHFDIYTLSVTPEYNNPEGSISIPADASGAFAVGATYWGDDSPEYYSSRGPTNDGRLKPDVTAPDGVNSYAYGGAFYGTSASTPHVAGAAALLLSYNHSLTPDELKNYFEETALDLGVSGKDNQFGSGRIDVYKAYQLIAPPLSISNLQNSTGNFWINWTWTNPSDFDFNHTMVFIDGVFQLNTSLNYYNATFLPHENHTISTRTVDSAGNINSTWVNQTTEIPNNPPVLSNLTDVTAFENETVFIELNATDADNDTITYFCNRTDLFADFNKITGRGNWTTQTGDAGTYYVEFGASDGYNGTDNLTLSITIYDNSPPQPITDLQAEAGTSSINWTWTNPSDFDFNHTMVYLNGEWVANITNNYYEATNLNSGTEYEVGIRTVDKSGLINATWVNMSVRTEEEMRQSRAISSGGGGGGLSITPPQMEAVNEVTHSEIRYFMSGKEITFTPPSKIEELTGLIEIKVISDESSPLTVTVGHVKEFEDAPSDRYTIISMFELVVSKYGVKLENGIRGTLKFRVSKELLETNGIVLIKFDSAYKKWVEIPIEKESEDEEYLHYTTNLTSFSVFAIAGIKEKEVKIHVIPVTTKPPEKTPTPPPEKIVTVETPPVTESVDKGDKVETPHQPDRLGGYDWCVFIAGIILAGIFRNYIRKNR